MAIRNGLRALLVPRRSSVGTSMARYGSAESSGVQVRRADATDGAWITRSL